MRPRVLVIDDHSPSRSLLTKTLNEGGFEVAGEGAKGSKALELCLKTAPDVVLLAVGLPDLDGIQVAKKIMEEKPTPIVLLTSRHDPKTIEAAKAAGVMAYLVKPFREEELFPVIELAISHFNELKSLRKENEELKRTLEARKTIERAKGFLMKHQRLSEAEAFSLMQKKSMDMRKPMVEIARAIILAEEMVEKRERSRS
jgi:AmiR/NasT family two-component response regulator